MNPIQQMLWNGCSRFLIPILFSAAILVSCQKEDDKPFPKSGYPYTYYVLSEAEWNARNAQFQQINVHDSLSLDEYGFVTGSIQLDQGDSIDVEFVIRTVDELILTYRDFMGIYENSSVNAENDLTIHDLAMHGAFTDVRNFFYELNRSYFGIENISMLYFWITQNRIGTAKFGSNYIGFHFDVKLKQVQIKGNWFPEVFIPSNEIYSENEALEIAFNLAKNKLKNEHDWIGDLREDDFSVEKKFIPIHMDDKIEIHECWFVSIPVYRDPSDPEAFIYHHYEIFVDTQTADILRQRLLSDYPY